MHGRSFFPIFLPVMALLAGIGIGTTITFKAGLAVVIVTHSILMLSSFLVDWKQPKTVRVTFSLTCLTALFTTAMFASIQHETWAVYLLGGVTLFLLYQARMWLLVTFDPIKSDHTNAPQ